VVPWVGCFVGVGCSLSTNTDSGLTLVGLISLVPIAVAVIDRTSFSVSTSDLASFSPTRRAPLSETSERIMSGGTSGGNSYTDSSAGSLGSIAVWES